MSVRAIGRFLATLGIFSGLVLGGPALAEVYFGKAVAIDGDTLELGGQRIRLYGIDAVEASQTCERDNKAWPCGLEATSAMSAIVETRNLQCESRDVDQYGRIVAVCTRDGRDIARAMVQMGLAVALPEFSSDYIVDEATARSRKIGIWAGSFQMPQEFRSTDTAIVENERAMLSEFQARKAANAAEATRSFAYETETKVYYRNCREARAAGVTPLYRGQPGYGAHMDGDGDGIACEPFRGRR